MSDPKLISPLLDGFTMGDALTEHDGVFCCPALQEDSGDKYMVKIVSIPASQVQLDALLLTGAYENEFQAEHYFKDLADAIDREAGLLDKLSDLEGFVPYQARQTVKMKEGVGYQVYLLSPYRQSLAQSMLDAPLTQLAAVNLGLDMCAALTVARRAGYLYANLQPSNIYLTETHGYCIGDLGFIPLASLKYASLPEKYFSAYTAPEVTDAYAALNDRLDVYALGLTLYQVYNNGQLPAINGEPLPYPEYADYELARIILKACSADPADRWETPAQMGQELVNYMQRNGVEDVSIIPAPIEAEAAGEGPTGFLTEEENEAQLADMLALYPEEEIPELPAEEPAGEAAESLDQLLAQADDLIEHELPEPVVIPDPIDVPIPPPILPEPEEEPAEKAPAPEEPALAEPVAPPAAPEKRSHKGGIIAAVVALLLLVALGLGAWHYYQNIYIQTVDALQMQGVEDELTVTLTADIDDSLLRVVCSDTYGNTLRSGVQDGKAHFTGLAPDSHYQIHVEIDGWHKLVGTTSGTYATDPETKIMNLSAVIGSTDGSVTISFAAIGPEPEKWQVEYSAQGEKAKTADCSGTTAQITGLTVGKEYTFRLLAQGDVYLTQDYTVTYTARNILIAENLRVEAYEGGTLTVAWDCGTATVWTVRLRSEAGDELTAQTSDTAYTFEGLDDRMSYTATVLAEGMSQSQLSTLSISADPITVSGFATGAAEDPWTFLLSWEFSGTAPTNGWILTYTVDGGAPITEACASNSILVDLIPGAAYTFQVQPTDPITCVAPAFNYQAEATTFTYTNGSEFVASDFACELSVEDGSLTISMVNPGKIFPLTEDIFSTALVIRNGSQILLTMADEGTWYTMATEKETVLSVPELPKTPGEYELDIFVNGMLLATLSFTV